MLSSLGGVKPLALAVKGRYPPAHPITLLYFELAWWYSCPLLWLEDRFFPLDISPFSSIMSATDDFLFRGVTSSHINSCVSILK